MAYGRPVGAVRQGSVLEERGVEGALVDEATDLMRPLSLALCVFDTTKQHFGRKDIYRDALTSLFSQIPPEAFATRLVHIKASPNEEEQFARQEAFYLSLGFTVLRTDGEWRHHDEQGQNSHQRGYSADLIKVYGHPSVLACDYVWHFESDWKIDTKGEQLIDRLVEGISALRANPRLVGIRFPRFLNEEARLNNLKRKHNLDVRTERRGHFIYHCDNLSLNPGLFRAYGMYLATRLLRQNPQYQQHVEHGFTHCLSWMSDGDLPWAIYDPARVSALHIGTKEGEEDVAGNVWETIP